MEYSAGQVPNATSTPAPHFHIMRLTWQSHMHMFVFCCTQPVTFFSFSVSLSLSVSLSVYKYKYCEYLQRDCPNHALIRQIKHMKENTFCMFAVIFGSSNECYKLNWKIMQRIFFCLNFQIYETMCKIYNQKHNFRVFSLPRNKINRQKKWYDILPVESPHN